MKTLFLAALLASTATFAAAAHGDKASNDNGKDQVCTVTQVCYP